MNSVRAIFHVDFYLFIIKIFDYLKIYLIYWNNIVIVINLFCGHYRNKAIKIIYNLIVGWNSSFLTICIIINLREHFSEIHTLISFKAWINGDLKGLNYSMWGSLGSGQNLHLGVPKNLASLSISLPKSIPSIIAILLNISFCNRKFSAFPFSRFIASGGRLVKQSQTRNNNSKKTGSPKAFASKEE